jgi:hypothetical protein
MAPIGLFPAPMNATRTFMLLTSTFCYLMVILARATSQSNIEKRAKVLAGRLSAGAPPTTDSRPVWLMAFLLVIRGTKSDRGSLPDNQDC